MSDSARTFKMKKVWFSPALLLRRDEQEVSLDGPDGEARTAFEESSDDNYAGPSRISRTITAVVPPVQSRLLSRK